MLLPSPDGSEIQYPHVVLLTECEARSNGHSEEPEVITQPAYTHTLL